MWSRPSCRWTVSSSPTPNWARRRPPPGPEPEASGLAAHVEPSGEVHEVVERFGVRQRVAACRLLRGRAREDPLHRDLQHLAGEGSGDLGDLKDLIRDVAR